MKISWLAWGDEPGGVASALLSNARLAQRLGHRARLIHFEHGRFSAEAERAGLNCERLEHTAGSHAHYLAPGFSLRGILRRLDMMRQLRAPLEQMLSADPPDLLCIVWPDLLPLLGPICRRLRIGLVLEMPNTPSRYPLAINQRAYAWAVRRWRVLMLANSAYSAHHLRLVPGVQVQPPGLEAERFDPIAVRACHRAELGLPEDAVVIGQIARLEPAKGADLAIAALATLPASLELHLLLVGGPLDSGFALQLRDQVRQLGLEQRVHWIDTVADPERYWPCCDLALSARKDAEPFGLSIIEAMLMQRPVIVHALGAPTDTVGDGLSGWHYHEPTAAALAKALQRALTMRAQWPVMGARARAAALHYVGPEVVGRYLALLQRHATAARIHR